MRFDLLYICLLCAVIIGTFFLVLFPQPTQLTATQLHAVPLLHRESELRLSPGIALLFTVFGCIYLNIIWQLINPPSQF